MCLLQVNISQDYELEDKLKKTGTKSRTTNDQRTAPDVESYTTLPFSTKDSEFAAT